MTILVRPPQTKLILTRNMTVCSYVVIMISFVMSFANCDVGPLQIRRNIATSLISDAQPELKDTHAKHMCYVVLQSTIRNTD